MWVSLLFDIYSLVLLMKPEMKPFSIFETILLQILYFKRSTREHETHNFLSFGRLFCQGLFINKKAAK